ncbi:MAG TPA: hypothetical protein ENI23_15810 [bacterium]|nr:hypothetical protein [bacterium]
MPENSPVYHRDDSLSANLQKVVRKGSKQLYEELLTHPDKRFLLSDEFLRQNPGVSRIGIRNNCMVCNWNDEYRVLIYDESSDFGPLAKHIGIDVIKRGAFEQLGIDTTRTILSGQELPGNRRIYDYSPELEGGIGVDIEDIENIVESHPEITDSLWYTLLMRDDGAIQVFHGVVGLLEASA